MSTFGEILKKMDIETVPLLLSVLMVLVFVRMDLINTCVDMAILFIVIYLLCLLFWRIAKVLWCSFKKRKTKKEQSNRLKSKCSFENNLIYNYFLELSEQKLKVLIEIIKLPKFNDDVCKRVIPSNSSLKMKIQSEEFAIPIRRFEYIVLVRYNHNYDAASPLVIDFDSYFYQLILNYMNTGRKNNVLLSKK